MGDAHSLEFRLYHLQGVWQLGVERTWPLGLAAFKSLTHKSLTHLSLSLLNVALVSASLNENLHHNPCQVGTSVHPMLGFM